MIRATRHANRRMRQRGIRQIFLDLLLDNADVEVPIGSACTFYRVSRELATTLNADDRLARYGAIVSQDGALVTVMPIRRTHSGARYRRMRR